MSGMAVIVDEHHGVVLLDEQERVEVVITPAGQGLPGPPGPAGGQTLQRTAGETMSALRAVYEAADTRVWLADAAESTHVFSLLGVTLTAAPPGQPVDVQRAGVMDDAGWAWTPGQRVFLGPGGALTQTPPAHGFDVLIGVALSATRLLLNLSDPIEME